MPCSFEELKEFWRVEILGGSGISIGDNVKIGAASFVNKDIPSDVTYITRKESVFYPR